MTTEERLDRIEQRLEELIGINYVKKADPIEEWPKIGYDYWFLDSGGDINKTPWDNDNLDNDRREFGNVFEFEKEACNYLLRLESMTNRWKPDYGNRYYTWSVNSQSIVSDISYGRLIDQMRYQLVRIFKTEEEAVKHRDTYQGAWEELDNLPQ